MQAWDSIFGEAASGTLCNRNGPTSYRIAACRWRVGNTRSSCGASSVLSTPGLPRLDFFEALLAIALVVRTGDEFYALPLPTVEGVLRLSKTEVSSHLGRDQPTFDYNGQKYRFQNLRYVRGPRALAAPGAGRHHPRGARARR